MYLNSIYSLNNYLNNSNISLKKHILYNNKYIEKKYIHS